MQVPLLRFGSIKAEGQEHENDIVIGGGHVRSTPRRRASSSTSGNDRQRAIGAGDDDQSVPAPGPRRRCRAGQRPKPALRT
jgi:hypothetical protein